MRQDFLAQRQKVVGVAEHVADLYGEVPEHLRKDGRIVQNLFLKC
jgi:hypothetical protein